jgi:hypothetical protein
MSWYDFLPDSMEMSMGVLEQNPVIGPVLSGVGSVVAGVDVALHGQDSRFLTYNVNKDYLPNFYKNFVQSLQRNYSEDRNIFNILGGSAWDGTYDFLGDIHGTPARLGSSIFLTQNALWNEIVDKDRTKRSLGDTLDLAWNREAIANISPGQAWATLVGDMFEDVYNIAVSSEESKRIFDTWTERNALFMNPDFDIFDEEQRLEAFEGTQNIGRWSSGLWDALPGQILDPLNYLPIIGWGGKIGKVGLSLKKDKNVQRHWDDLYRGVNGEVTESRRHFEWVAQASDSEIAQHVSYRETRDQMVFAQLLGKTDNVQDAYRVHLAIEFGDAQAIKELVANPKYGGSELLLDSLYEGGYLLRQSKRGVPVQGVPENKLFNEAGGKYLDEFLEESPFVKKLLDNVFVKDETGRLALSEIPTPSLRFRFSGNKFVDIKNQKVAEFKARALGDHENAVIWLGSGIKGLPVVNLIVRAGIRAGTISGKGFIDANDIAGDSYAILLGNLNDLNKATKGQLAKNGDIKRLASKYLEASNALERSMVIQEIDDLGRELIAKKYGLDDVVVKDIVEEFSKENKKYIKALTERKYAQMPDGQIVYDPLFPSQVPALQMLTDWKLFNTAIKESGDSLAQIVGVGKRAGLTWVHVFNNLFIASILGRGARIPRELLQNTPAAYLSGEFGDMFLTPEVLKAPRRFVQNMTGRGKRLADKTATKFGRRDNVKTLYKNASVHQDAINYIDNTLEDVSETLLRMARQLPENVSKTDEQILKEIQQELVSDIYYHGSRDGLPESIDAGRVLALSSNKMDAQKYADEAGEILTFSDKVTVDDIKFEFGTGKAVPVDSAKVRTIKNNIKEAIQEGRILQTRKHPGDNWRTVTLDDVNNIKAVSIRDNQFRFLDEGQNPITYRLSVYGKNVGMDSFASLPESIVKKMGWKSAKEFEEYMASKKFATDKKFINALEEENIGTFTWNNETFANPNRVGYGKGAGKKAQEAQEAQVKEQIIGEQLDVEDLEIQKLSRKERVRADFETLGEASRTRTYISEADMDNLEQVRDMIIRLKARRKYHEEQKNLFEKRAALREEQFEKTGGIQRRGQEELVIDGQVIPGAAQGVEAIQFTKLASAAPTFDNTMQGGGDLMKKTNSLSYRSSHIKPSNPEYFDSWSQLLNREWRKGFDGEVDPLIRKILQGESNEDIIRWLRNDLEGIRYADSVGIGPKYSKLADKDGKFRTYKGEQSGTKELMEFDDYVEVSRYTVDTHIPDELRQGFLNGEDFDPQMLRSLYKGKEGELPDIIGSIAIPQERRNLGQLYYDSMRGLAKYMGELPQTAVFNHPMFVSMYKRYATRNVKLAMEAKAARGLPTDLTPAEINKITFNSRKDALMEQRRWIYNVPKRTNASEALRLFFPFISAWAYTYRLAGRGLAERPAETIWLLSGIAKTMGKIPYVDREGNPTNNYFDSVAVVLPVPEVVANSLKKLPVIGPAIELGDNIKISTRSMDVFFQGEFFDPGAGVIVAIPTSEIVKNNPGLMENRIIEEILPFGPSQKPLSIDLALPGYTKNTMNMIFETDEYKTVVAQITLQEHTRYRFGDREDEPTTKEIEDKANSMFMLRSFVAFASPVSFTLPPQQTFYAQEFRKYVEMYPDRDEATWRFLADHPEWYTGMQTITDNPSGIFASVDAVDILKNNKDLISSMWSLGDGGQDMIGFLANGEGTAEYSQASRDWLKNNGPVSGKSYLPILTPEEVIEQANIRLGWVEWRKYRSLLQDTAKQRGTTIAGDPELAWYNSRIIAKLQDENPDWYREYASPNRNKYNDRAAALELMVDNDNWVEANKDRAIAPYLVQFLQYRRDIAAEVDQRAQQGGPRSLEGNKDLLFYYNNLINDLMNESQEFTEFYIRYFERDMVK